MEIQMNGYSKRIGGNLVALSCGLFEASFNERMSPSWCGPIQRLADKMARAGHWLAGDVEALDELRQADHDWRMSPVAVNPR